MSTSKEMGKALRILRVIPLLAVVLLLLELYAVGYLKGNWEQAYAVCAVMLAVFLMALYRRYLSTVQQMLQISEELDSHFSKVALDFPEATKEEATAGTECHAVLTLVKGGHLMGNNYYAKLAVTFAISLLALWVCFHFGNYEMIRGRPLYSAALGALTGLTILTSRTVASVAVDRYHDWRESRRLLSRDHESIITVGDVKYRASWLHRKQVCEIITAFRGQEWFETDFLLCGDHWLISERTTSYPYAFIFTMNGIDGTNTVLDVRVFLITRLTKSDSLMELTQGAYLGVIRGNTSTPGIFTQAERSLFQSAPHETQAYDPWILHRSSAERKLLDIALRLNYNDYLHLP